VALAAAARFWGLGFGLPHTQARPDETYLIDIALGILKGSTPPRYDYPWFYAWISAALYLGYYAWGAATGAFQSIGDLVASWPINWAPFFLINRSMSAILGVATVLVVFRIGRRVWDERTGLVAAFFLALAYLHARDSHFGTTDVPMTCFIMLSVALLVDAHRTGRRSRFAWAGVAGGLAAATKYNAILLAAPMLASQMILVAESPGRRLRAAFDIRLLFFGIPFAVAFLVGIPFVFYDTQGFLAAMELLRHSMEIGSPHLGLNSGWVHHLEFSLRHGLGMPLLAAALGGTALLLIAQPRVAALLMSFPIAYCVVAGASRNQFFRYMIPVVPFLCLAAARLVTTVGGRVTARWPTPWAPALATAALAVTIVGPSAASLNFHGPEFT
jgi:4-amino-4-deoxy-L-arabinose transferase-like glycosyltransferase